MKALELSKDAKDRVAKLEELSDQAADGGKEARKELRRVLCASSPAVVAEASKLAKKGEWGLIKTAAAGDPLMEEALLARLDLMRSEIAGPDPSPLEVLLVEKIVAV